MDLSTWFLFLRVYGSEVGSFNNFTPVDVFQSYLDSDSNEVNAVRTNEVYFQNKTVILITGNTLLPKLFNETIDYGSYNVSGNWSNGTDYESNYTTGIFNNYDAIHLAAMVATAIILGLIILATVIDGTCDTVTIKTLRQILFYFLSTAKGRRYELNGYGKNTFPFIFYLIPIQYMPSEKDSSSVEKVLFALASVLNGKLTPPEKKGSVRLKASQD
ncbi:hypothetical protein RUM44_006730 [Polyplax serrata]|uniref:Uncharacterized protein n=1 Tax=Polyplax serrata TaxID=468196 RepID=A0ABR1AIZ2_POLSC